MRSTFGTEPIVRNADDAPSGNFLTGIFPTETVDTVIDSSGKFYNTTGHVRCFGIQHIEDSQVWFNDVWVLDLSKPTGNDDESQMDGSGAALMQRPFAFLISVVVAFVSFFG
mmetsp:Transcript_22196/g.62984  ORF Transcript_22196/g.62984 Transcript_22196/m.62984 type:complete len:112 (-) Transcript_22196:29-364(-)